MYCRNTWLLFALFTALHLYANYRGVRSVRMSSLNRERFRLLLRRWLEDVSHSGLVSPQHMSSPPASGSPVHVRVPRVSLASVDWVNAREPVLLPSRCAPWHPRLRIGHSLTQYLLQPSNEYSIIQYMHIVLCGFVARFLVLCLFALFI